MTSDTQRSELPLWSVEAWGDGSTPPYLANIFCDAHEATIAAGLFKEHAAAIVEAHNEALSTPPKVGSEELDAAKPVAWRGVVDGRTAFLCRTNDEVERLAADYNATIEPLFASPVDHPEVVGEPVAWQHRIKGGYAGANWSGWLEGRGNYTQVDYEERPLYIALQPSDSPALEAGVAEVYEAAKAVARYRGEIAQMTARGYARQDYRFYMERVDALLDEAIQVVEDLRRERAALSIPAKEDGK